MALSKLITMYSKSTIQVLRLFRANCYCQGQQNAGKVASSARLKDANDRIWLIKRQQKRPLRKVYQLMDRFCNGAELNNQRKNIALHSRLFNKPFYINQCMIHTTSAVCDDKGDSRRDIVISNESGKILNDKAELLESDCENYEGDNRLFKSVNNVSTYNGIDIDSNSRKLTSAKTKSFDSCQDAPEPGVMEQEDRTKGTLSLQHSLQPVLNNQMSEKIFDPQNYMLKRGILKFLEENDLNHTESYTGYNIVCPKFGKVAMKRNKEEHQIYINYLSGSFKCSACGKTGNWNQLQDNVTHILMKKGRRKTNMECFKDMLDLDFILERQERIDRVKELLDEAKDLWTLESDEFENILSLFDWQGITKQTFKKYGVKFIQRDNTYSVYFPLVSLDQDLTGTRVYTAVITEEEDVKLEPIVTIPRLSEADIFGWQTRPVPDHKNYYRNLVITTGEIQAMAVTQQTTFTAVSIKNIDNFAQEHVPNLEKFEKIFLWLGTDLKAWEMSKLVAKRLNEKRCLIFRPANVNEMPLECIHTEEDIRNKLKIARNLSHEAIHQFQHLRHDVYREFSHHEHVTGVKWKKYFKLNDILKGFRQGELTVLTGPTGCGKTTFLSEYSLDLCMQGVNTLWGSFEISNVRLIKVMMQQLSGKNLAKHLDEFDDTAKEFMGLPMYFMAYHGSQNVNTVLETMCHAVYVHNIQHVILDNLQFMVGLDHFDDPIQNIFLRQDRIVSQFRKFATENNCHVTLIIHPRKIDRGEELSVSSIFGSAKVSQEADNIYLIQDNRLSKPGGRKYLQITKNRFDGDLGVMTLTFDKESLSFSMNPKKKPNQVEL